MEAEITDITTTSTLTPKVVLTKLVLGAIAGFVAGKLTDKAVDAVVTKIRNR